ncbi:MAG: hypothetical protein KatS3mg087_1014 [Patescibacteria group bacterium]|nr:MAG: hypothetical protein KatS3mg087_1014 [Patescibacteria group bacterium]
MSALIVLLICYLKLNHEPNYVDVLELNHVYNVTVSRDALNNQVINVDHTLSQWIGWDFHLTGELHVSWWRLYRGEKVYITKDGKYRVYIDGREVIANTFIETESNYDREIYDRQFFEEHRRKGLYDYREIHSLILVEPLKDKYDDQ